MRMKSLKKRKTGLLAAALVVLATTTSLASSAAASEPSSPLIVGTGHTDVSSLDVQGWEGTEWHDAPPAEHPAPGPTARTDKIACGGRIDFYRVINFGGGTTCFQKAGTLALTSHLFPVAYVCPGNNARQVEYDPGLGLGGWMFSTLRDGHSNFNACWRFDRPTTTEVRSVRIK